MVFSPVVTESRGEQLHLEMMETTETSPPEPNALAMELEILKLAAAEQERLVREVHVRSDRMLQEVLNDKDALQEKEAGLAAANEFTSLVLNMMDEVLIVLGTDGRIQRVNKKLSALLGYEADELLGSNPDLLLAETSLRHCLPAFDPTLSASHSVFYHFFSWNPLQQVELTLITRTGQAVSHDFRSSILHNHQGKKVGVVVVGIDLRELKASNNRLNHSLMEVKEANRQIMDSIHYAKTIQRSLLSNRGLVQQHLPQSFFLWEPKDVIGGDIYHVYPLEDKGLLISLFDCTGHGVPGAFMTVLTSGKLDHAIRNQKLCRPDAILRHLNSAVRHTLHQDSDHAASDDGLDAAVCHIDPSGSALTFAGARLSLLCIHNRETVTVKGDRHSLGYRRSNPDFEFAGHVIPLRRGMVFYLWTDGITDQVGGDKGLPFGRTRLMELLKDIHHLPFARQKEILRQTFQAFTGEQARRDDITVIGFSID